MICVRYAGLLTGMTLAVAVGCSKAPAPSPEESKPANELVRLEPAALSRNGIRVVAATTSAIQEYVDAPAEVQLSPDRVAHISPPVPGQVQRVNVTVGDYVTVGMRLAVLRSVELGQARAELQKASALAEVAQANFKREEVLRAEGIASERSYLEAQARHREAQAELEAAHARLLVFGQSGGSGPELSIAAPIAGTVIERHATPGENVGADKDLFVIADTSRVWVIAHVYEKDMAKVQRASAARLSLQGQQGRTWDGAIGYVAPVIDEKTRTLEVRMELPNKGGAVRPGLFGRLQIATGASEAVVAVPEAALQTVGDAQVVFVPAADENTFRPQEVQVGRRGGEVVEIREGLQAGDRFVVDGAFLLKSQLLAESFGEAD